MPGASPPLVSTPSAVAGTDVIATHPCTPGIADALRPFDAGFTVLMDTVVADRAELDFLLALMSPRAVRLVTLAPGTDACKYRNATRDAADRFDFDGYEQLEADMQRDLGDVGWWFDTSTLTPRQTAAQLVAEASDRAAVLRGGWQARPERRHGASPTDHNS